jgi:hypothetical protein
MCRCHLDIPVPVLGRKDEQATQVLLGQVSIVSKVERGLGYGEISKKESLTQRRKCLHVHDWAMKNRKIKQFDVFAYSESGVRLPPAPGPHGLRLTDPQRG